MERSPIDYILFILFTIVIPYFIAANYFFGVYYSYIKNKSLWTIMSVYLFCLLFWPAVWGFLSTYKHKDENE